MKLDAQKIIKRTDELVQYKARIGGWLDEAKRLRSSQVVSAIEAIVEALNEREQFTDPNHETRTPNT